MMAITVTRIYSTLGPFHDQNSAASVEQNALGVCLLLAVIISSGMQAYMPLASPRKHGSVASGAFVLPPSMPASLL